MSSNALFNNAFLSNLRNWIGTHHSIYPHLPPQGIYFESLVERAFLHAGWPKDKIKLSNPNSPRADITVDTTRLSLKTETGKGTQRNRISITKLLTTETGDWTSEALIQKTLDHLARYEGILMLRAIWNRRSENIIDYQLIEIPLALLQRMASFEVRPIGRRQDRKSLACDIHEQQDLLFHIHFDGADGKCQISKLSTNRCIMLAEWEQAIPAD